MAGRGSKYSEIWLSPFFHGFPHIDLTFQYTNSTFNPENSRYQEALIFWASLPVLWCILSLLVFCCYFIIRCCRKKTGKRKKATCLRIAIGIILFIGIGAVSAGFFGDDEAHNGVSSFITAIKSTNKTIYSSMKTLASLDGLVVDITNESTELVNKAAGVLSNATVKMELEDLVNEIISQAKQALTEINTIKLNASSLHLGTIASTAGEFEHYRALSTIVLYAIHLVLLVLLLLGVYKMSRILLIVTSICCLVWLIFTWAATGFYLGLSVASGDLCVDPKGFVEREVGNRMAADVLEAYLECTDDTKPFSDKQLVNAQQAVAHASTALNKTIQMAKLFNIYDKLEQPLDQIKDDLRYATGNLSSLSNVVSCRHIHDNYIKALNGICVDGLIGFSYMLLMTCIVGMVLTLAVALASRAWPHFGKIRGYAPVDDSDPFLPRPPPYETYGTMGDPQHVVDHHHSNSTLNRSILVSRQYGDRSGCNRNSGNCEYYYMRSHESGKARADEQQQHLQMYGPPVDESPPPAYHPKGPMQRYRSLANHPSNLQDTRL